MIINRQTKHKCCIFIIYFFACLNNSLIRKTVPIYQLILDTYKITINLTGGWVGVNLIFFEESKK